jgi:phage terminase small subunit
MASKNAILKGLTEKQKAFCREYIREWNATHSYLVAYPNTKNENTAGVEAFRLLRNPKIEEYITEIQKNREKLSGLSFLKVIEEHKKLAFSSIAHLHNTWIERKDFELLTEDQKTCIAEISTQVRKNTDGDGTPIDVEFIKIKLYDKQKALDSISKMLGYDAPIKTAFTDKDGNNSPIILFKNFSDEGS